MVLAAALGLLGPASAAGQSCTGTAYVPAVTPASLNYGSPAVLDFDNGGMVYSVSVTINSGDNSQKYSLCAHASTVDMGLSTDGTYRKPISDIQVKLTTDPVSAFKSLTQTDVLLTPTLLRGKATFSVDVKIALSWALDAPGNYLSSVLLTGFK